MNPPQVSIITPTFRRGKEILARCLGSVRAQTFGDWMHLVASDGEHEPHAAELVAAESSDRVTYSVTTRHYGGFGAGVRQELLMTRVDSPYVMFLDDDSILLPPYLEKMVAALEQAGPSVQFAICAILHFGPLPFFMSKPPALLPGEPKLLHIDTLQVLVRTPAMKEVGWMDKGYLSDGFTYQELGRRFPFVRVPDCLAVHL
jgi:glycosyltransferase involved in cell wall biosynthesis